PGEHVALELSNVMVASLNGTALPATVANGTFTCGCGPTSTTTSSSTTSTSTTASSSTTATSTTTSSSTTTTSTTTSTSTTTTSTTTSSTTTMPAAVVTVSVPADLCVDPGATVDVPVALENAGAVRGLSFALQDTPDELQLASGSGAAACTARTPGFTCTANEIAAANVFNAVVLSFAGDAIAPGTGPVVTLRLTDGGVPCTPAQPIALTIANVLASDVDNHALPTQVLPGSVRCGCATTTSTTTSTTTTSTSTTTTSPTTRTPTSTTIGPPTTTTPTTRTTTATAAPPTTAT